MSDLRGINREHAALLERAYAANLPETRQTPEARQAPENGHDRMRAKLLRIRAVERAGELMGKARLAGAMGQSDRTMRAYTSCEIAMPDAVLTGAAGALEREAQAMLEHAAVLRDLAGQAKGDRT